MLKSARASSREVWTVPLLRTTYVWVALRGGSSAGGRVLGPHRRGSRGGGEGDQLPGMKFRSHPSWSKGWGGARQGFACAKRWKLKVAPVALSVDTVLGNTEVAVVGVHGVRATVVQWAWVLGVRGGSRHAGMVGLKGWACFPASQQAFHTRWQASQEENLVAPPEEYFRRHAGHLTFFCVSFGFDQGGKKKVTHKEV
ncbi:hypothetical protein K438DRAFT_1774158 [Mycena galopus ATCC 62051]|nr:hypothetical protein K438DRAFT_1774158 [Mycena galopus ATCC 62051]